jgi:hypothetical protein
MRFIVNRKVDDFYVQSPNTKSYSISFFKEDVKGLKVYNIIIDIYGETKLEQDVGNQLVIFFTYI